MIELKRLNVIRRVESEEKAVALEAQGFKRLPTSKGKKKSGKKGDDAAAKKAAEEAAKKAAEEAAKKGEGENGK